MRHEDGYFGRPGEGRIYHQCWLPDGEPKATILLVHGLAEHSGRYSHLVEHLVARDYAVYGLDHPGHGRSDGQRVYIDRFDSITGALADHAAWVRSRHPSLPCFAYGHSIGALVAALHLFDHASVFSGVVFSGPCVQVPESVSPFTVFLARALSKVTPRLGIAAIDSRGISRDPQAVQAYVDDPLVYNGRTTARLSYEMLRAMRRVPDEAVQITCPTLIIQGGADPIVDPAGARMLFETISSEDKDLRIYDGMYHELHNEPEHLQVLAEVGDWLDARVGAA